ncbi:MAG TPA: DUF1501 domain-containing protein [Myxococcales bacterium LLY-WYZ-16_1]|nr:DUF1501 domain-containing protein [Myxococcales bacterium LLY-WYZ-16_1]
MSTPQGITRRSLLRRAAGAAAASLGGSLALERLAAGMGPSDQDLHYVFAYFSGGWDIILGLDPKDPAVFTEDEVRQTQIQPAYDQLDLADADLVRAGNFTFGPYIGELRRHADKLAVVRGMSMETLTHEAGRRRFITGKPPSGLLARGSSAATHLAARLGEAEPIPNLAIQVETYNVDEPNYATGLKANGVDDLVRALRPGRPALPDSAIAELDGLLRDFSNCAHAQGSPTLQAAESARQKARQMVERDVAGLFDFASPDLEALRGRFGIPPGRNGLRSYEAQAALAAQAITGGVSRVVSIQVSGGLDTHFSEWSRDQGPRQRQGFDAIARLIDELESRPYGDTGESWLDHTVIVGFSEFSRTPLLNDRGGRDHSLTNACFLCGAKIRGGTVVGASSDRGMEPQPVNLGTGRVDPGGEVVKPEHVIQTLLHDAGYTDDFADLRVGPIDAIRKA